MPRYSPSPAYRDSGPYPVGVLLVNSGTPDSLTAGGIRSFLRRLLRDRRTIEVSRAIWCWILYFIILPLRPIRVVPKYRRVWTERGSPLLLISRELRERLEQTLSAGRQTPVAVELGMLYSTPDVAAGLRALRERGAQRVLVLPLFPQYSATTNAAAYDQVGKALRDWRFVPELRYVLDYHAEPAYLDAVAASLRDWRAAHGSGGHLLFSFHGIPAQYVADGDPYERKCHATAGAVAARLGLAATEWSISFQSRVGTAKWVGPYTDDVVARLAQQGVRRLDVACPGFAVDCLETIDEMGVEAAETFRHHGGETLRYIPALNASPAQVEMLAGLVAAHAGPLP
ncbi:MAG: ferrochelatase [Pseudomonadota bacterium]